MLACAPAHIRLSARAQRRSARSPDPGAPRRTPPRGPRASAAGASRARRLGAGRALVLHDPRGDERVSCCRAAQRVARLGLLSERVGAECLREDAFRARIVGLCERSQPPGRVASARELHRHAQALVARPCRPIRSSARACPTSRARPRSARSAHRAPRAGSRRAGRGGSRGRASRARPLLGGEPRQVPVDGAALGAPQRLERHEGIPVHQERLHVVEVVAQFHIVEAGGERRRVECVHGVDRQPRAWPRELP